jgi:hypothetical protein
MIVMTEHRDACTARCRLVSVFCHEVGDIYYWGKLINNQPLPTGVPATFPSCAPRHVASVLNFPV